MTGRGLLGVALAVMLCVAAAEAGPRMVCTTVDGAPAATSESLVLGMQKQIEAGDEAGLQKFLDTGQTMRLIGGNSVEVIERKPEQGLVKVRRGERQLSFWTLESGISCAGEEPKR